MIDRAAIREATDNPGPPPLRPRAQQPPEQITFRGLPLVSLEAWTIQQIMRPGTFRRFCMWMCTRPILAVRFLTVVTGGKVTDAHYAARMKICTGCQFAKVDDAELYCKACNCPQWFMSKLARKNRFRKAACPKLIFGRKPTDIHPSVIPLLQRDTKDCACDKRREAEQWLP